MNTPNVGEGGVMVKCVKNLLVAAIDWRVADLQARENTASARLDVLRCTVDSVIAETVKPSVK